MGIKMLIGILVLIVLIAVAVIVTRYAIKLLIMHCSKRYNDTAIQLGVLAAGELGESLRLIELRAELTRLSHQLAWLKV